MKTFNILPLDISLKADLSHKINQKTKPLGALGKLEALALQIGQIQHTLTPQLDQPTLLVFAGDHGITQNNVSPYPQSVTAQMVLNFLQGTAAINVFAKQNRMKLRVIDAGVNHIFDAKNVLTHALIDAKIAMGTCNFSNQSAMTLKQCEQALTFGATLAKKETGAGCNIMGFGEMGIGNTSSASCLMSVLCGIPIEQCVGRGTGLDDAGLAHKTFILKQAIAHHALNGKDAMRTLACFGGFEIAMMAGAMLGAAEQKAILLIDGFIASAALLVAYKIQPNILDYCVFAHCSNEQAHRQLLAYLNATTLLDLDLRLGEGTGAALAYPLVQAAVNFLNEMASFESAGVSQAVDAARVN
ncbi:MAG: nicotinate-nucleotide--dimethylbenzimidazole phosphoribosyltransferase [Methylotenera sp.]|nr:nicotinate-nucleotide--dimethylbenzimidazole phosphoribosyltransferase [Methylotenera sp.]